MIKRKEAIIAMTPAVDHSEKIGYFVILTAGLPVVSASAADVPFGVLLDGEEADGVDSIGICGGNFGPAEVKLSAAVSKGDYLQLHSDGSVIEDAATGARVIVALALEDGVSGALIEAVILTPVKYA